jgi:predicted Zn-dependent peptidase
MLNTFTLHNGTRVATYSLPSLKSIHVRVSVKGGSIVESKSDNGVAHFMEHMLVQGIPSYPTAEAFSRYIEGLAGNYGAFTERLLVGFTITVPATHVDEAIRIAGEVFYEPLFDPEAIEKERIAIIDEVLQRKDSHLHKISKYFLSSRFRKNHPLLLDGGGSVNILKRLKRVDLIEYWQKYFFPENTYIHISGNFSDDTLRFALDKYFGMRQPTGRTAEFPTLHKDDFDDRRISIRRDTTLSTCYVDLTFPSLGLCDELLTRLKQNLALVILGQLRNSRLFRLLRYQRGLVYDVRAGSNSYPGLGYAYISLEAGKPYLDEALSLIIDETASFVANGPSEEELAFAKNYLTSQWLMTFDHPSSIAGWVESHLLWDEKGLLPEDYALLIKDITVADLVAFMAQYWDFSKMNLNIQGPLANSTSTHRKYAQILSKLLNSSSHPAYMPLYS